MTKATTKRKAAKFGIVEVINLICPDCEELCVNETGSQMINRCDEKVYCEHCNTAYDLPTKAIKLFLNM